MHAAYGRVSRYNHCYMTTPTINRRVLMSSAEHFSTAQQINPYYDSSSVDLSRASAEHRAIGELFERAGIRVDRVPAPEYCQDGVYTANWGLVKGTKAVLARLPNARKKEEAYAKSQLERLGLTVLEVPNEWHFSGQGDALAFGDFLFCGSGYRSDERAQVFAAEALGFERIQLQTIPELDMNGEPVINRSSGWPDSFFYDIDLALSIIRQPDTNGLGGLIAYCPEAFTKESQEKLAALENVEKILVSFKEATKGFACNLVSTGTTVIMSNHAPQLQADLESRGFTVLTPEVNELIKGGGFIRCVSLTLE